MIGLARLGRSRAGSAAAEMALVMPLLLTLMFGSVELGNFLYSEHLLQKAVRDGARYAARQNFTNFDCATNAVNTTVRDNTRELVRTSLLSGGTERMPNWGVGTITLRTDCYTTATDDAAASQNMTGIYAGRATGAPLVTVTAVVPYRPVIGSMFGFVAAGNLNATQQAAVMGI